MNDPTIAFEVTAPVSAPILDSLPLPPRRTLTRLFVDFNPFYLLSAMCMLAGLFALNDSLDWSPMAVSRLLGLIGILNVYEVLLIALGLLLFRRGMARDAATLLVLEAFFLVDAGFLNAEIFTSSFELGCLVNAALFVMAVAKVVVVFRALGVPLWDGRFPLILLQVLVLLGAPGVFRYAFHHHQSNLPPLALYGMWWIVGAIPLAFVVLHRGGELLPQRGIISAFVLLPLVSILAHLCTTNWVYNVRWDHANLSPLLLGLAVAIGVFERHLGSASLRMRTQLILPILAIILSAPYPSRLIVASEPILLTPLRLTLVAAAAVYLHGLLVHRHALFGVAMAACLGAATLGESPAAISHNVTAMGSKGTSTMWKLVPRTVAQWGIVSVVASFVLLGLGLLVSLLRGARKD